MTGKEKALLISAMLWTITAADAAADIFERYSDPSMLRQEALRVDRSGYDATLVAGGYIGIPEGDALPPASRRNWSAKSVSDIDPEEVFDKDLRRMIERDRKNTASFSSVLSNNSLLLMSYASPAMADILKHYRASLFSRMNIEYERSAQKDNLSSGTLELFYRASLDACLYQERARGFLGGLEVCRKEPPLGHIKDPTGQFVTTHRPWAIVMDTLTRVGLSNRAARLAVAITGDVVIDPQGINETAPTRTFFIETEARAKEQMIDWIKILKNFSGTKRVSDVELDMLSWPGFSITRNTINDLLTLKETQRVLLLSRMVQISASGDVKNDIQNAIAALDKGIGRVVANVALKGILRARKVALEGVLADVKDKNVDFRASEELFETLLLDADTARKEILAVSEGGKIR